MGQCTSWPSAPKSFIVISDPAMVRHFEEPIRQIMTRAFLAEILEPVMGKGLIPADPITWKQRRKAIVPGFHKKWLNAMMGLFSDCNTPLLNKLPKIVPKVGQLWIWRRSSVV